MFINKLFWKIFSHRIKLLKFYYITTICGAYESLTKRSFCVGSECSFMTFCKQETSFFFFFFFFQFDIVVLEVFRVIVGHCLQDEVASL